MIKKLCYALAFIPMLAVSGGANAQHLVAVQPIAGYGCMALNLSEKQMNDPSVVVQIRSRPDQFAPPIGVATAIVIVAEPSQEVNGFVSVLHLNGRQGWILARDVKPMRVVAGSRQKCVPSMMSNGRIGFAFQNS